VFYYVRLKLIAINEEINLRIINLNLNGINSALRKGFLEWMLEQNADFISVQEIRSHLNSESESTFCPPGYRCYFKNGEKKGYSGVGIYAKYEPTKIIRNLGWPYADNEGRFIELQFPKLCLVSLYLPSGRSGLERQEVKFDFLKRYLPILEDIIKNGKNYIITGDFNIAHKQIDIKNWKTNQKHSGFLPEERAWLDDVIDRLGFVDAFRILNQEPNQYTWWSNFSRSRERNVGWRIDYQLITPNLKDKVKAVNIYKEKWFSDHAPLIIDYDLPIDY
jgi:exodeoxyribonuclease III